MVLDQYKKSGLPLDAIYLDIPYMDNFKDFTVDTTNFPDLPGLASLIHDNNQKLIVIVDPMISAADPSTYPYYKLG